MHITRLELENYRGFEVFEIDLHPEMTLLVGENASGKTSVVDALTFASGRTIHHLLAESAVADPGAKDRRQVPVAQGGIVNLVPQLPMRIQWAATFRDREFTIRWTDGAMERDWGTTIQLSQEMHRKAIAGAPVALPLVSCIRSSRGWTAEPKAGEYASSSRLDGYKNWVTPAASQAALVSWFRKYTFVELQEGAPVPQLRSMVQAIRDAVPKTRDVSYNVRQDALWVTFDDDRIIPFSQLSDGFRNMVALVADLAWRAAVLNPHLEDRAARETEGVVLIDEIELHLHPRWQREVLGALRRAFPKLQFVVTTHSPQVIASAKREWVRLLDGSRTAKTPSFVEGRDSNAILEDVLGVPERPKDKQDRIDALFEAIDGDDTKAAQSILAELEAVLGPNDSNVVRAHWLLDVETP